MFISMEWQDFNVFCAKNEWNEMKKQTIIDPHFVWRLLSLEIMTWDTGDMQEA